MSVSVKARVGRRQQREESQEEPGEGHLSFVFSFPSCFLSLLPSCACVPCLSFPMAVNGWLHKGLFLVVILEQLCG